MGVLLLAFGHWQAGRRGFQDASLKIDQESLVTPWLIRCWLNMVVRGLQRAHANLSQMYDLSDLRTFGICGTWNTVASYFSALGWTLSTRWGPFLARYSAATRQFLFGIPSQYRARG